MSHYKENAGGDGKRLFYIQLRSGAIYDNEGFDSLWFVYSSHEPTTEEIASLLWNDIEEGGQADIYTFDECITYAEQDVQCYEVGACDLKDTRQWGVLTNKTMEE